MSQTTTPQGKPVRNSVLGLVVLLVGAGLVLVLDSSSREEASKPPLTLPRIPGHEEEQEARTKHDTIEQLSQQRDALSEKLAASYLENGLNLANNGDVDTGLLWMARALEALPNPQIQRATPPLEIAIRANIAAWADRIITRPVSPVSADVATLAHRGQWLVVADGMQLRAWDLTNEKSDKQLPLLQETPRQLQFSPNDQLLLVQHKSEILIVDFAFGIRTVRIDHQVTIKSVVFSPDSRRIVTISDTGNVQMWDVETGKVRRQLQHDGPVRSVVYSDDGKLLLSLSGREVRLWETETGKIAGKPLVHTEPIDRVVVSRDGSLAATTGSDKTLRVWKIPSGEAVGQKIELPTAARSVGFTHDSRHLVAISSDGLRRWTIPQLKEVGLPIRPVHHFGTVSLSSDRTIAALEERGRVTFRDVLTGDRIGEVALPSGSLQQVVFSDTDRIGWKKGGRDVLGLVEKPGEKRPQANVWRLPVRADNSHALPAAVVIEGAEFTLDAGLLLTWGAGKFWLFDHHEHRLQLGPIDLNGPAPLVRLSPKGNVIVAAGTGTPRAWDGDGKPIVGYERLPKGTWSVVLFSPNSQTLLLATDDGDSGKAMLVRPDTGELLRTLTSAEGLGAIRCACFSKDSKRVMTGGSPPGQPHKGEVHDWLVETGTSAHSSRFDAPVRLLAVDVDPLNVTRPAVATTTELTNWVGFSASKAAVLPLSSPPAQMKLLRKAIVLACRDGTIHFANRKFQFGSEPTALDRLGETGVMAIAGERHVRYFSELSGLPVGPSLWHPEKIKAMLFHYLSGDLFTVTEDGVVRRWRLHGSINGTPSEVLEEVQRLTGKRLDEQTWK